MKEITKEDILQAIGAVTLGKPEKSLMQNCHVETVKIDQGRITFIITIESGISNLKEEAEDIKKMAALGAQKGKTNASKQAIEKWKKDLDYIDNVLKSEL